MKRSPLVSICMPTFRRPQYAVEMIVSILGQTFTDWELLISDNSEDEQTEVAIKKYTDNRIVYWRNEKNIGIGRNVRKLIDRSSGKYLTFTPDDDWWASTNLERKVNFLEANTDVSAVFSNANRVAVDGSPLKPFRTKATLGAIRLPSSLLMPSRDTENAYFIQIATALIRAETLKHFLWESFHFHTEEYFMWYLGCIESDIGFIGDPLVTLREAEHFRTGESKGKVVDARDRSRLRQMQLLDIHRCLAVFHPDIAPILDKREVKEFVARAVINSGASLSGVLSGLVSAAVLLEGVSFSFLGKVATRRLLGRVLAPLRGKRDVSGIGPIT